MVRASQSGQQVSSSKVIRAKASMDPCTCMSVWSARQWYSLCVSSDRCWERFIPRTDCRDHDRHVNTMAWNMCRKSSGVAVCRSQLSLSRMIRSMRRISDDEQPQSLVLTSSRRDGTCSSSSQVLAARKKQAMAIQRRYFGRALIEARKRSSILTASTSVSGYSCSRLWSSVNQRTTSSRWSGEMSVSCEEGFFGT